MNGFIDEEWYHTQSKLFYNQSPEYDIYKSCQNIYDWIPKILDELLQDGPQIQGPEMFRRANYLYRLQGQKFDDYYEWCSTTNDPDDFCIGGHPIHLYEFCQPDELKSWLYHGYSKLEQDDLQYYSENCNLDYPSMSNPSSPVLLPNSPCNFNNGNCPNIANDLGFGNRTIENNDQANSSEWLWSQKPRKI